MFVLFNMLKSCTIFQFYAWKIWLSLINAHIYTLLAYQLHDEISYIIVVGNTTYQPSFIFIFIFYTYILDWKSKNQQFKHHGRDNKIIPFQGRKKRMID